MKIEKRFTVAASPDRIWTFITDPEQVAPCIPGCKEVVLLSPGKYRAVIGVQVGPIKASFAGVAEVREERPPDFAEYAIQAEEGGNSSRISAVARLAITPLTGDDCEVSCVAEVNISGRLGKFGAGVMQKIADNLGDKFAAAMGNALQQERGPTAQAEPVVDTASKKSGSIFGIIKRIFNAILGRG
ncbi:CoxG family protein [Novosphingobium naphthalenivorans]|uniref:CoxG family protein n=1 Tax=Novosphingobium naphthalenivorans TaxID=273168 RepID=UPI0009FD8067|nr:SRPBCC domain-containing protein [Novosphingobium naphthalenivorans]